MTRLAALACFTLGCGGGLDAVYVTDLQNAATLDGRIYAREHADGGPSVNAALARAAFCATETVLESVDAGVAVDGVKCGP
jgi:hypothetical protein